jgi:hypothetical protein
MSLLAPAALGLLSLAIPLVVLYMLRSRRRRVDVPSVMLWEGEEQFVSASLPWQRLKITAALVLQLLALAAFAFLLARPFFREETLLGPHTVLIVDTSGSMATAGRLESAKARISALAADASAQQLVSLVEAGPRPQVLVAFSRDPEAIRDAAARLQPGGGTEDLEGALRLARGLTTPDRPTSLLVLSDGGVEGAVAEPVGGARHLRFDATADNLAVTAFGTGVPGEGGPRVFLEVASFANRPETATAEIRVDGLRVATVDVELAPGARAQEIVAVDAGPGQAVEVELLDNDDGNPLDDRSALVLAGGADLSVTVLGAGSPFLDALVASVEGVRPAAGEPPDLVIVDGGDAASVDRPAWLIAPETPPPGVDIAGLVENPIVTYQRPGEPILDGLDLADLAIAEADVVVGAGWLPILSAGEVPLIQLGEVNGHRVVYFTFDVTRSSLPVQVTFPIMGSRILDWLGGSRVSTAATAPAGTAIPVTTPAGGDALVTLPDGTQRMLDSGLLSFDATALPGLYRIDYRDTDGTPAGSAVAARQFVAAESAGGSRTILTTAGDGAPTEETALLREWAPAILVALLVIVLLEWWVAYGRPWPRRERSVAA